MRNNPIIWSVHRPQQLKTNNIISHRCALGSTFPSKCKICVAKPIHWFALIFSRLLWWDTLEDLHFAPALLTGMQAGTQNHPFMFPWSIVNQRCGDQKQTNRILIRGRFRVLLINSEFWSTLINVVQLSMISSDQHLIVPLMDYSRVPTIARTELAAPCGHFVKTDFLLSWKCWMKWFLFLFEWEDSWNLKTAFQIGAHVHTCDVSGTMGGEMHLYLPKCPIFLTVAAKTSIYFI